MILKGDFNRYYSNTVWNTSLHGQGDLCAVTSALSVLNITQQNIHSEFWNSVNKVVTGQSGPSPKQGMFHFWAGISHLNETEMKLVNPGGWDFRPRADSPLRGAGVTHANTNNTDIGAYQFGEEHWSPGCTFHKSCYFRGK